MQTRFPPALLADPAMATSETVIRKCVHCGFCLATCPTYALLGDERDSPRGRIYMIKEMLENERAPTAEVVRHVDRCLSCLSCMTTCPSGVNYMHLVDHARAYIEQRYRRPWPDRAYRWLLASVLPHPARFRLATALARPFRFAAPALEAIKGLGPLAAMLRLAPKRSAPRAGLETSAVPGANGRVIMLQGCVEPALRPEIRAAAVRLINRAGYEVLFAAGEGCCGALAHHMGRQDDSLRAARRNIDAWTGYGLDDLSAIVTTASGCGVSLKDYGFMLRDDLDYAARAARISALAVDISELLARIELPPGDGRGMVVAYHAACSLQHGQQVTTAPQRLLQAAGFVVRTPAQAHLCCGSAGVYNILQPQIAGQLGEAKAASLQALDAQVIATGNIGCAVQIGQRARLPVLHLVELLDWASGGPVPEAFAPLL